MIKMITDEIFKYFKQSLSQIILISLTVESLTPYPQGTSVPKAL